MLISMLEQLINGLRTGSIYALIALGYTMVYGIAKMINFAHGDIIMVGAYTLYIAISLLNLSIPIAILLTVIVCSVTGVAVEKIAYKPLRNAPPLAVLITAIGVSYFLQSVSLLIFKANPIPFNSVINIQSVKLGSLNISGITIVTLIVTTISMIALTLFINKTKAGTAMRAVSEDKGAAQLVGINVNKTISMTFAIGSANIKAYYGRTPWNKSICCRCIGRNWKYTWCYAWWYCIGYYRKSIKSIYFYRIVRRYCFWCTCCGTSCKTFWNIGQKTK